MIIYIKSSGTAIFREGDVLSFNVGRVDGDVSIGTVIKGYSWILISKTIEAIKRTIAWKQRVLRGIKFIRTTFVLPFGDNDSNWR